MKKSLILITALFATAGLSSQAQAGCVKGAVVGGVAGHMVHHGKVGAVAGCIAGHHHAKKHRLK